MVPPEVESHGFAMDVTVTEGRTGMVNVVVTQPARRRGVTVLSIRRDGVMPEESFVLAAIALCADELGKMLVEGAVRARRLRGY